MLARLTTNPLLIRATYHPGKLSISSGLRYGFAAAAIASALGVILLIVTNDSGPIRSFLGAYAVLILALPAFLAYAAAVVTVNVRRKTPLDLLYMTAISNQRLSEGYTLISLYRFKNFLALLVGFTPLALLWIATISIYDCQFADFCPQDRSPLVFLLTLAGLIVYAFNVMGIGLLMTAVGVFLGVAFGNRILSSLSALLIGLRTTPLIVWGASARSELLLSNNLPLLPIVYSLFGVLIWLARLLVRKAD
jgi:hypothetical protein